MERVPEPELMDLPDEAQAYAEADFETVNNDFVERLVELAGRLGDAEAVDLGAGPADITIRAARALPSWRLRAVDASQAMLDLARTAIGKADLTDRIELVLTDAKGSLLPDDIADVVFSNSILHHINDTASFWRDVHRIARPGAHLLLRDLLRPETPEAARAIVKERAGNESQLLQEEFYRSLLAAYTIEEVRDQLRDTGLEGLAVEQATEVHLDVFGIMGD